MPLVRGFATLGRSYGIFSRSDSSVGERDIFFGLLAGDPTDCSNSPAWQHLYKEYYK
jgi:hypothetical protein